MSKPQKFGTCALPQGTVSDERRSRCAPKAVHVIRVGVNEGIARSRGAERSRIVSRRFRSAEKLERVIHGFERNDAQKSGVNRTNRLHVRQTCAICISSRAVGLTQENIPIKTSGGRRRWIKEARLYAYRREAMRLS